MQEIELKFQVPPRRRAEVDAAVAGRVADDRIRLQATYFDTEDRALARAGMGLRLRREARRWVQTLKGGTGDAMTRFEHNVPRIVSSAPLEVDPGLHAGTSGGKALNDLLAKRQPDALSVRYRTDVLRRARRVRVPGGQIELAFDVGRIHAGDRAVTLSELEFELLQGSPQALLNAARRWVPRYGLWLDTRSKAERGDLLSRAQTLAPPQHAAAVVLSKDMSDAAAWRVVLAECAQQIMFNASQVASGEHLPEHVHQLRVGLRRLRCALRFFEDDGTAAALPALGEPAATLFRRLGVSRDATVLQGGLGDELMAALRRERVGGSEALIPAAAAKDAPSSLMREPASQFFLLDLLTAMQPPDDGLSSSDTPSADSLQRRLAHRLNRWHRHVLNDCQRFVELDDDGLHRLRKRTKRLRYAAEFAGALFERRSLRRYLKVLGALQDRLGAITDGLMAARAMRELDESDCKRTFALGWLAARRDALVSSAAPDLKALRKVDRFWKS